MISERQQGHIRDAIRHQALQREAVKLEAEACAARSKWERDRLLEEAIHVRARMLALELGTA